MKDGFSVSFWINTTTATAFTQLFGVLNSSDGTALAVDLNRPASGGTQFYVRASLNQYVNGATTAPIYNQRWQHVAMVVQPQSVLPASYDNYMQVYINGQSAPLTFTGNLTNTSTFTNFQFAPFLGALNNRGNAASFANAAIDEFAVFTRPLSQAEIQSHLDAMPRYDFAYDGTYPANSTVPPLGQTTWRVHNDAMQAINTAGDGAGGGIAKTGYMRINDNANNDRTAFWQLFDGQGDRPGPVADVYWTYEARLKIDSLTATAGTNTTSFLGVRDEGGNAGKQVMLGWQNFQDGETDRVRVGFFSNAGVLQGTTLLALDASDFFDEYFDYRVEKYWNSDAGAFQVQAYIDDAAVGGVRSWSSFPNQVNADNGFGFFSSTPGMIDVTFDYVTFAVPEPSAALLLGTALLGLLPWRRRAR